MLIGGTNGKGSTQALVASVLREAGYRVGQTPKPHLLSYRERIVVDGGLISPTDFADVVEEVIEHAEAVARRYGPPTEFEVLTAAAFEWFKRARVEVAVVEVGLGGRLDATNVWQGGVSAITNVALDHMEHLGNTIEAIAREKAQIIKRGDSAAITGATEPALGVIRRRASRVRVPLHLTTPLDVVAFDRKGLRVAALHGSEMRVGLLGRHQAANAAVAIEMLSGLEELGLVVPANAVERGLASTRWPGRMELVERSGQPDVVLDGAHNPAGVASLATALAELLPQLSGGSATVLLGVLANHWQHGMLDPLVEVLRGAVLIATRVPGSTTSLDPAVVASTWGAGATAIADTDRAFEAALERSTTSDGPLVVCGSLYLVGYVRAKLIEAGALDS